MKRTGALVVAALIAALSLSAAAAPIPLQRPSPSGGDAQAEHKPASTHEGQDASSDQRGTQSAPFFVQVVAEPKEHETVAAQSEGEGHWYANPDWWVAGFTGMLFMVTAGLWFATWKLWKSTNRAVTDSAKGLEIASLSLEHTRTDAERQAKDNRTSLRLSARAANAARKAADAADLSAKAAIGVELPFLYIEDISFDTEFPENVDGFKGWCDVCSPQIRIKNFGRTPAFVSTVIINCKMGPLTDDPVYETIRDYPVPFVIDGRGEHTFIERLFMANNYITWDDLKDATNEPASRFLYLYGVVTFTDFMGSQHTRGSIFCWSPAKKAFAPTGTIYKRYDYQT